MKMKKEKGIKDTERKEALKAVPLFLIFCFTLNFAYFKLAVTNNTKRDYHFLSCIIPTLFGLNAEANGTSLDVIGECTRISSIIVYCSIIFAYPLEITPEI